MHQKTTQLLGSVVCVCVCVFVYAVMDSRGFAICPSVTSFNSNLKYFWYLLFKDYPV